MQRFLWCLLAALSLTGPAKAQTDSVDAFVREFIRRHHIPAAAVSVVHHGRVVKAAGYGLANLELNVAATGHSVFEIGSMSKQVSAEAVMLLAERGQLGLDDPLAKYLPGLPDAWSGIRLRHLLTHTSGLHDWEGDSAFSCRREYTTAEFMEFVARHPLDFPPGSRFAYTNSAFPLLGKVVEKVSGVPYERFVTEQIFKPAGMLETRFRHQADLVPNRAAGYADMARWNIALTNGRIVSPATMDLMTTPIRFNDGTSFSSGIAWFFDEFRGHP